MTLILTPFTNFLAAQSAAEAQAQWAKGPTVKYKSASSVPIADYVGWIRAVESSPQLRGESTRQILQRIRRVLYSNLVPTEAVGQTGALADKSISKVIDHTVPPLTTEHVSIDVLNGLFGTGTIRAARNIDIDISHLWIAADATLNGTTFGMVDLTNTSTVPLVTWAGDLGTAIRNFCQQIKQSSNRQATPAQKNGLMRACVQQKASKDDLLGDLDAVVLSAWWKSLDSFVLSNEIERYYKDDDKPQSVVSRITHPKSARRFHWFVNLASEPEFDAAGKQPLPLEDFLDVTLDKADALDTLETVLIDAAADVSKRIESGITGDLDRNGGRPQFDLLCVRFAEFLEAGLATGDAPWPGTW